MQRLENKIEPTNTIQISPEPIIQICKSLKAQNIDNIECQIQNNRMILWGDNAASEERLTDDEYKLGFFTTRTLAALTFNQAVTENDNCLRYISLNKDILEFYQYFKKFMKKKREDGAAKVEKVDFKIDWDPRNHNKLKRYLSTQRLYKITDKYELDILKPKISIYNFIRMEENSFLKIDKGLLNYILQNIRNLPLTIIPRIYINKYFVYSEKEYGFQIDYLSNYAKAGLIDFNLNYLPKEYKEMLEKDKNCLLYLYISFSDAFLATIKTLFNKTTKKNSVPDFVYFSIVEIGKKHFWELKTDNDNMGNSNQFIHYNIIRQGTFRIASITTTKLWKVAENHETYAKMVQELVFGNARDEMSNFASESIANLVGQINSNHTENGDEERNSNDEGSDEDENPGDSFRPATNLDDLYDEL